MFVAGKTKGCFYPPPYLDDYGETDQGLKYVHTRADTHTHKLWLFVIYLFMFASAGEGTLSIFVPSVTGK